MTEHPNEVIADDNAGTLLAIESIKQLKARYVTAAEWEQMGQHAMNTFHKRLLPLAFGMLMYEGDPAVMRRTLSNVPLPARLLMLKFSADQVGGYGLPRLPEDPWELAGLVQEFAIGFGEVTQARHGCVDDPVESVH
jgi:hypothetical protein